MKVTVILIMVEDIERCISLSEGNCWKLACMQHVKKPKFQEAARAMHVAVKKRKEIKLLYYYRVKYAS
ncbi:hypothetical protein GOBAR_AA37095 [Gossypium barbadense]|uniref:Uncharacterized protein n=1 Tax=Gossypium barbadense TaxID=3634 RepID=A0A2P5VXP4_GOSBA|nr:hypothetical protein GOBAR_AA37095 [Gossypium barbadense]